MQGANDDAQEAGGWSDGLGQDGIASSTLHHGGDREAVWKGTARNCKAYKGQRGPHMEECRARIAKLEEAEQREREARAPSLVEAARKANLGSEAKGQEEDETRPQKAEEDPPEHLDEVTGSPVEMEIDEDNVEKEATGSPGKSPVAKCPKAWPFDEEASEDDMVGSFRDTMIKI